MKPIIFATKNACSFFQIYGPPPEEWFDSLSEDHMSLPTYRGEDGDILIFTAEDLQTLTSSLCAALLTADGGLLREIHPGKRRESFNRILRVFQSVEDHGTSIPALWKPYNSDSLISIQGTNRASGAERILIDRRSIGQVTAICYGVIEEAVDLNNVLPELIDPVNLRNRLSAILDAAAKVGIPQKFDDSFDLEENNIALGLGDNLQTWYESKLTARQRDFVDTPISKSLRVRGPAGSGKTIAMVVKILRLILADRQAKRNRRYAFLTHSQATVDLVRSMIKTMLSESDFSTIDHSEPNSLYLGTLYSFAFDTLGTELRGVDPLSLDGREGRQMQAEMLHSVLKEYLDSSWVGRRNGCGDEFVERLERASSHDIDGNLFLKEILNEFACVIEPEGIARSLAKQTEYLNRTTREPWRLALGLQDERGVILDLHRDFRKEMRESGCISVDQLVSDFDRFLGSNAWELTRVASGFDAIFVDELHLLNRLERMLILSLTKNASAKPVVVMAEDTKQDSLRVSHGLRNWQGQFSEIENFDFTDVFRYTPQINNFLKAIDDFAPTLHLEEDWPQYGQISRLADGPKPKVSVFASALDQYEKMFAQASLSAKQKKNGRLVAVLDCDYENFKKYLAAGQHRSKFIPVESRDDITSIPNRGLKFVFSMPEFVAGLQFEEVFLLDINNSLFTDTEAAGVQDKRRALSTIYLGASRAMRSLHISSLKTSGGLPTCISHAIESGICDIAR